MVSTKILSAQDELEVLDVNGVYENFLDLMKEVSITDLNETYYQENLDDKNFRSTLKATKKLDEHTKLILNFVFFTKDDLKETEQGLYGTIVIKIDASLELSDPESPKILKPFHKIFRDIWFYWLYKRQYEYWEEYTIDSVKKILKKIRDYYGLLPPVGKVKRMHYKPF